MTNPIFCALDTTDQSQACSLATCLAPLLGGLKLGLEFFTVNGGEGVRKMTSFGLPVFLDLKLHDIPNTVAGAIRGVVRLAPAMTTVHASGGAAMMRAAVEAAGDEASRINVSRPLILAVTVLTSTAEEDLPAVGVVSAMTDQVKRLAALAQAAGLDGVIASPHEIETLRRECGPNFKLVIPGIRPVGTHAHDQKRVLSPAEALAKGADYLVIGRPITAAVDPLAAATAIVSQLG
jgi:orotidine-5'-phosphate decarboxylase